MRFSKVLALASVAVTIPGALDGIITYGICQTGKPTC